MKDLNNCCDKSKCDNCAFNGLDTFCTLARALPNAPFSIFIERVRSELNELDKEKEYSEVEGLEWV